MSRGRRLTLIVAAAAVIGAALWLRPNFQSEDSEPPPPSSPGQIARVKHAPYRFPVYWFGKSFRGHELRNAGSGPRFASFTYGEPSCDPGSGCSDPYVVQTSLTREPATDMLIEDTCWIPVGKAWLLGCDGFEEGQLYTDRVEVYLSTQDTDPEALARRLKRLNRTTPEKFKAPVPLSCAEVRRMPRRFRNKLPRALRPHCG